MSVPTNIGDLSTTAGSNPPNGSSDTPQEGDDHLRAAYSFIAQLNSEKAPKASPTFTGTPVAPTAAVDTNTTQVATTAYVVGQGYLKSATAASTYAPLASPTFTGTVTAATVTTSGAVLVNAAAALNSGANRGNVTIDGTASSIVSFGKSGANIGYVYADATKMQIGSYASLPIELITGNSARLTIDSTGMAALGRSISGSYALEIADISSAPCLGTYRNGTTTAYHAIFNNGNGQVGGISTNGSATTFATSSDYRLKNIAGDLQTSGAFIDALQPRVGTWKVDGSPFVGFVAHELQSVSPSSVTGEKDGEQMQSVAYGSAELIANMVAELKSLRARVAALESV